MRIAAVHGLSPTDDFYLWGLLGLALSQPEPNPDFHATPYWCLKQLGLVTATKKGSEEYRQFRESLRRLAGVRYECNKFYDPIRHEHREVSFGFLSYSLPLSDDHSRAWRFAWDPIFWEICSSNAGALRFDIGVYRTLSPGSRRFYLLLKKLFWRNEQSPQLEIRELAINTLGFSPQLPTKEIKRKVIACVQELFGGDCDTFCCTIGGVGNTELRGIGGDCATFFLSENVDRWLAEAIAPTFSTYAKVDCLQGLLKQRASNNPLSKKTN